MTAGYNLFGNNRPLGSKAGTRRVTVPSDESEWPPNTQAKEYGTNASISEPSGLPKVKDQSDLSQQQGTLFGLIGHNPQSRITLV